MNASNFVMCASELNIKSFTCTEVSLQAKISHQIDEMTESREFLDGRDSRLRKLWRLDPGDGESQVEVRFADVDDDGRRADHEVVEVVEKLNVKMTINIKWHLTGDRSFQILTELARITQKILPLMIDEYSYLKFGFILLTFAYAKWTKSKPTLRGL